MTVAPRYKVSQMISASLASQYSGSQDKKSEKSSATTKSALTTQ